MVNSGFLLWTCAAAVIAGSMVAAGCKSPSKPDCAPVVQLSEHAMDLRVGDSLRLALLPMLPPGCVPSVDWTTSDSMTATVAKSGALGATVKGIRPGQAVITASGSGESDSAVVTVASNPNG